MTAGPVNRALLESNFQNPGDVYSDLKTEGAFDVVADQIDDNWDYTTSLVANGTLTPYPSFLSRQALINGNFDVWQRGTSFTNPSNVFTADRWLLTSANDGGTFPTTIIHSQQAMTPGTLNGSYFFYRINTNGAGSGFGPAAAYGQKERVENGTRYLCGAGKKVTISFYARSDIAGKRLGVFMEQRYGTGGSPTASELINGTNFTLTSTFQKYTVTFTTNTLSGKTFGTNNDDYFQISLLCMWGSNLNSATSSANTETFVGAGNIDIAQVQVNSGDVALPFQPRSLDDEFRLCQRYYEVIKPNLNNSAPISNMGITTSTTTADFPIRFNTTKRTTPTVTLDGASGYAVQTTTGTACTALSVAKQSGIGCMITATVASGLTAVQPCYLREIGPSGIYIDAEL